MARANRTDCGLAAVVWTNDLTTAHTLPPRLRDAFTETQTTFISLG